MSFKQVKSGQYLLYFNETFKQLPMNEFWSRKLEFIKHGPWTEWVHKAWVREYGS